MILKNLFSKRKQKDVFPDYLKWIDVSFVVCIQGTKREIEKIAEDITNIINNTHSVANKKGEIVGYVNPYTNFNIVSVSQNKNGNIKNIPNLYADVGNTPILLNISRNFYPVIKNNGSQWRLTFIPEKVKSEDKTNLYSFENFNIDLWMLAGASNIICEKYKIPITEERMTYKPILLDGIPALEVHDHLLIIKYHVIDRIKFLRKNEKLEKSVLGNGETIFEIIKRISKTEFDSEWVMKAKILLKEQTE